LCVGAPGLCEAEWDGRKIAISLLRAVGFLSRHDLHSRPGPAGPSTRTPAAQCPGPLEARLFLLPGLDPGVVRAAELGLKAVPAGPKPLAPAGEPLLELSPVSLHLVAAKAAEDGDGWVVRVANPTDESHRMHLRLGPTLRGSLSQARPVRLDETPIARPFAIEQGTLSLEVPPHALRSIRLS
jgi:alpha-mannosidase